MILGLCILKNTGTKLRQQNQGADGMKKLTISILKHLFALVSIVGGHWLNGQYKKGVLFSLLLIPLFWVSRNNSGYHPFSLYIRHVIAQDNVQVFYTDYPLLFATFPAFIGIIVLIILASYYTYWRDAHNNKATLEAASLTMRCFYALLLPFAMIGAPLSSTVAISEQLRLFNQLDGNLVISSFKSVWRRNIEFTEQINEPTMHHLGSGNGTLLASVTYRNQPLTNITFSIMWQEAKVRTWARSDAYGNITLSLPTGTWHIREIDISGADSIEGVNELPLSSAGTQSITPAGLELTLRANAPETLSLQLKPPLELLFPESTQTNQTVAIDDGAIRWQPDPQAHTYRIELYRYRQNSFDSNPIASRTTENPGSLPIKAFYHVVDPHDQPAYLAKVVAMDTYGQVVSTSLLKDDADTTDVTFTLQGNMVLIPDPDKELPQNTEEAAALYWQARDLKDAERAIGASDFTNAKTLLEKVTHQKHAQQKQLMQGYLAAKQGHCDEARTLFTAYNKQHGHNCRAQGYMADCKMDEH